MAGGENYPRIFKPILDDSLRIEYAQVRHQSQPVVHSCKDTTKICDVGRCSLLPILCSCILHTNLFVDKFINLDNVLIQLRGDVSQEWYKFGLNLGIPKEVMDKYSAYPVDQCMIETIDYWLRHHEGRPTWREVAMALEAIKFHQLSAKILEVYVTGDNHYKV